MHSSGSHKGPNFLCIILLGKSHMAQCGSAISNSQPSRANRSLKPIELPSGLGLMNFLLSVFLLSKLNHTLTFYCIIFLAYTKWLCYKIDPTLSIRHHTTLHSCIWPIAHVLGYWMICKNKKNIILLRLLPLAKISVHGCNKPN